MRVCSTVLVALAAAACAGVPPRVQRVGNVTAVALQGTWEEMGRGYGAALRAELEYTRGIVLAAAAGMGYTKAQVAAQADAFYQRFPREYQRFVDAVAEGAGWKGAADARILHAMETLREIPANASGGRVRGRPNGVADDDDDGDRRPRVLANCAFTFAPRHLTPPATAALTGRNYDFGGPFAEIARHVVVAVLHPEEEQDASPTPAVALITMPGQIYCPSCINSAGVLMEMNNGMWSGGRYVNESVTSLLAEMAVAMGNARATSAHGALGVVAGRVAHTDYSLIVNAADAGTAASLEVSSTLGARPMTPADDTVFISTNFYQNTSWGNLIPAPSDKEAMSVTRYHNLHAQFQTVGAGTLTAAGLQALLDVPIDAGGAVWAETIYQIVYDPAGGSLRVKPHGAAGWEVLALSDIFAAP